jgi:hypothetical protein
LRKKRAGSFSAIDKWMLQDTFFKLEFKAVSYKIKTPLWHRGVYYEIDKAVYGKMPNSA